MMMMMLIKNGVRGETRVAGGFPDSAHVMVMAVTSGGAGMQRRTLLAAEPAPTHFVRNSIAVTRLGWCWLCIRTTSVNTSMGNIVAYFWLVWWRRRGLASRSSFAATYT